MCLRGLVTGAGCELERALGVAGGSVPVAPELVAPRPPLVRVRAEQRARPGRALVQLECACEERRRLGNVRTLESDATVPVEHFGAVGGVEPRRLDACLTACAQLRRIAEVAAVHLDPGEREALPECEGRVAANVRP